MLRKKEGSVGAHVKAGSIMSDFEDLSFVSVIHVVKILKQHVTRKAGVKRRNMTLKG